MTSFPSFSFSCRRCIVIYHYRLMLTESNTKYVLFYELLFFGFCFCFVYCICFCSFTILDPVISFMISKNHKQITTGVLSNHELTLITYKWNTRIKTSSFQNSMTVFHETYITYHYNIHPCNDARRKQLHCHTHDENN